MRYDEINKSDPASLKALVARDQQERQAYQQFVAQHANGDWEQGAELYAKARGRSPDDVFGERDLLQRFMQKRFDFAEFTAEDWQRYWLLAQHCDFDRAFQKSALSNIEQHLGSDNDHYRYLSDRISCGISGAQTYGTQDTCQPD